MVNLVFINGDGHKAARPVTTREDYVALRNAAENAKNFYDARGGNEAAKAQQIQFNYNDLLPDGVLKGCCHPSSTFAHDIDCGNEQEQAIIKDELLRKKDEIGLLELSGSARWGLHAVCRRQAERTIRECQYALSMATHTEYDTNARGLARVMFTGPATPDNLFFLDDAIFEESLTVEESAAEYQRLKDREKLNQEEVPPEAKKANKHYRPWEEEVGGKMEDVRGESIPLTSDVSPQSSKTYPKEYHGIPFEKILAKYWELNNNGFEPTEGDRDTLTFQLASDLRHICGKKFEWLDQVIPCYDGFPLEEKHAKIKNALASKYEGMPTRLRVVLDALEGRKYGSEEYASASNDSQLSSLNAQLIEDDDSSFFTLHSSLKKMPQGVRDSIEAVGPQLAMPALVAVAPVIGMLATGVRLDVHGVKNTLNLIAYVAGDFASGKGSIDPIVAAWTSELRALEKVYQQQEDEWRARKRAAKNKKEQPEEPKLPVRLLTLNNTVANLAERLANTDGKHAFSFTPEADTVAQKWKSTINDFSVMLRQSYDGSPYDREARSAEAVNVHIDHLLWNVLMCGTPDALYRVVNNYTDGFQSRIAVARTPDNTFARLEDKPHVLTDRQAERIRQVAHLLPLMQGEVVLPKLEQKGREWLEQVRIECIKSDDKVRARQRFRVCVTAQRMVCCILLCKVAEQLIAKHGYSGAEKELKTHPDVWKAMLLKLQTPQLLEAYDVIADYLLDCALYFFRDRIEMAFNSRDYAGSGERRRIGKNDSIFARLDVVFTFEGALQHSINVKGSGVTRNQVQQMLKNWRKQGLIVQTEAGQYRKVQNEVS